MKYDPVPLNRYFSLVPEYNSESDGKDFRSMWGVKKNVGWIELEKEFRCVILAEAGAGKSFEMEARAKHAEAQGRAAFFIRIEDVGESFEMAFEVGSFEAFECWMNSQEEAWFFLDSVDEARLDNPRDFEKAIKRFSSRIKSAARRAHIFITSRPYAWRAKYDRELLERYLPFKKPISEEVGGRSDISREIEAGRSIEPDSALQVYLLDPLDEKGIRDFASYREVPQIDRMILELRRANLMSVAARPFDLEGILIKWEADQKLGDRLELLQNNIDYCLKEINPDREQRQPLNHEKARRGARVLAAAVILTGEPGISVPDSSQSKKGIDAGVVLGDWEPKEVQALLERGIFNDALYGVVRFRHREVRELLAAEWFYHQIKNGSSRRSIENFFIREQYGHKVVTPRLRSVLPWLILFDDEIRRKVLEISPGITVEGGAIARLPIAERKAILDSIVRCIASSGGDHSMLDNGAIARIAQSDLSGDVLRHVERHRDNDDVIFFMGRLVWQGEMMACVPALSEVAVDPGRGLYARIAATRAVMTCGTRDQRNRLWTQLAASPEALPRRLLVELLEDANPDMASIGSLLVAIDKLEASERYEAAGLGMALHGYIDRLPICVTNVTPQPLVKLVGGLNHYLDREPYIERRQCHVSESFAWLLGAATHAVERLVFARSEQALSSDVLSVMLKMPAARAWGSEAIGEYKSRLHELVPPWRELNDVLFWRSIEEARIRLEKNKSERLIDDWPVQWPGHYWAFGPDRFDDVLDFIAERRLLDDKLVALSLAHRVFIEAGKPDGWLGRIIRKAEGNLELEGRVDALQNPVVSHDIVEWEKYEARGKRRQDKVSKARERSRAEWIKCLKERPDYIRSPPGLNSGDFSKDQFDLLNEVERLAYRRSRSGGAGWKDLIEEFGEDVAMAYRDAAVSFWRNYTPALRSEGGDTNSIPYALIFAMSGIEIESREIKDFPENLDESEVRHALRYLVWEINGFPIWLERVYRVYPGRVLDAVLAELHWELAHTEQNGYLHYILHDLVYHAPWIHQCLVPSIMAWMERNEIKNNDALRYCIHLLMSGGADNESVSSLAKTKITENAGGAQLSAWYALWVEVDADEAVPATERWLSSLPEEEALKEAQLFVTKLMGARWSSNVVESRGDFRRAEHLKALYLLMHRHIRAEDDIERAGKGVYSPELRDDAQDGRNALFNLLSEIPGKATYIALSDLEGAHPDARYRPWMRRQAYRRAEQDADIEIWSAQQVRDYDRSQVMAPETHRQLFELTVSRLMDLKAWVEKGGDSPYKTWQKASNEAEIRNLVAGWLSSHSLNYYTCAQENELSNKQRPDILMQSAQVDSAVPIELKVLDQDWSGPEICERLRNQLAGDYLREGVASCGVMLLIWQGRSSKSRWKIGDRMVALMELEEALKSYWGSVANNFPDIVEIDVILIDLTVRNTKSES